MWMGGKADPIGTCCENKYRYCNHVTPPPHYLLNRGKKTVYRLHSLRLSSKAMAKELLLHSFLLKQKMVSSLLIS